MRAHILFIDTETSGLPKKWDAPYADQDNWPFIVQIAWLIYSREGELLKTENHYILDTDYQISSTSRDIHGIDPAFLKEHGKERKNVMKILQQDLLTYRPLLVGHFMQLDYHMMGIGFYRAGLENPAAQLPQFCTMGISARLVHQKPYKYLKLGDLYEWLFDKPLENQHNALTDAKATAACFFELRKKGNLDESLFCEQTGRQEKKAPLSKYFGGILILLIFIVLMLLIFW